MGGGRIMIEETIKIEMTKREAEDYVALRAAGFFESDGEIRIFKEIGSGVIRYVKKVLPHKHNEVFIYQRKKQLVDNFP